MFIKSSIFISGEAISPAAKGLNLDLRDIQCFLMDLGPQEHEYEESN